MPPIDDDLQVMESETNGQRQRDYVYALYSLLIIIIWTTDNPQANSGSEHQVKNLGVSFD